MTELVISNYVSIADWQIDVNNIRGTGNGGQRVDQVTCQVAPPKGK